MILSALATCVMSQYRPTKDLRPKPFHYNYEVTDEDGNVHSETRSQDASGKMTGSFLMNLINGLFRRARYEADDTGGFRIVIESNEPGMGSDSPADATFSVQSPPAGIYESRRYIPRRRYV